MALITTLESATLVTSLDVSDSLSTAIQNATVTSLVAQGSSIVTQMNGPPGVQGIQGKTGAQGLQGIDGRDGTISGVNIDGGNAASRFGGTTKLDGGRA